MVSIPSVNGVSAGAIASLLLASSGVPVIFCAAVCPSVAEVIFTDKSLYLCGWSLCFGIPAVVGVTAISSVPTVVFISSASGSFLFLVKEGGHRLTE